MTSSEWRTKLVLLWLSGACLRLTILAVPPLLSQIHSSLHMSETQGGALTGLPVLLLALAAVPGSLLVAKVGARRALLIGLWTIALSGAARGLGASVPVLFVMTFLMGCGVAVSQPSLPSLVRSWMSESVGLATAAFSNGMLIGEILPVSITAALVVPLAHERWQLSLAFWSIPVVLTALTMVVLTTNETRAIDVAPTRWWPDWHDPRIWVLGLTLGGASASYWGANAFIPDYLRFHHESAYITPALTSLNLIQLPASFAVATFPRRLVARWLPLSAAGVITLASAAGIILLPGAWLVVAAGMLGFSTALVFVLTLSLPPLLAASGDTHRISAAMFTISYICPFIGAIVGGALWDMTGAAQLAFAPLFIGGLMVLLLPPHLDLRRAKSVLDAPGPIQFPETKMA